MIQNNSDNLNPNKETDEYKETDENENKEINEKTIYFVGLNGRLEKHKTRTRVKSFFKEHVEPKKRVDVEKWNLSDELLLPWKQFELLKEVYNNDYKFTNSENKLIIQQIERKISGYKQQDTDKNIFNSEKFVNFKQIVQAVIDCDMKCYYCNSDMALLYELVREHKQWTVDRVDNDLGHNYDNFVLACLECNLKRRRRSKDAYFFTKNLNIVKQNNSS
jgi:hypothetical protein